MPFDINGGEFVILLVVAVVVVGPERLPRYAQQLGRLVRQGRKLWAGTRTRLQDELGPDLDRLDWSSLDPRQYDPRRIIRDALREPAGAGSSSASSPSDRPSGHQSPSGPAATRPPFDVDAT